MQQKRRHFGNIARGGSHSSSETVTRLLDASLLLAPLNPQQCVSLEHWPCLSFEFDVTWAQLGENLRVVTESTAVFV